MASAAHEQSQAVMGARRSLTNDASQGTGVLVHSLSEGAREQQLEENSLYLFSSLFSTKSEH